MQNTVKILHPFSLNVMYFQTYTNDLLPGSVSIASNVEGFTSAKCFIGEPEEIVSDMYDHLWNISDKAYELMKQEYQPVLDVIDAKLERIKELKSRMTHLQKAEDCLGKRRSMEA